MGETNTKDLLMATVVIGGVYLIATQADKILSRFFPSKDKETISQGSGSPLDNFGSYLAPSTPQNNLTTPANTGTSPLDNFWSYFVPTSNTPAPSAPAFNISDANKFYGATAFSPEIETRATASKSSITQPKADFKQVTPARVLSTGKKGSMKIAVLAPARDAEGKTKFDRIVEANKKAKLLNK